MDRLVIRGGRRIEGSVQVCGAKNAALPQIAAALLLQGATNVFGLTQISEDVSR